MRVKKTRYGIMFISVFISVLLWFYVINQEAAGNPRNTVTVELSYVNAAADYTIEGPQTVSVSTWGSALEPDDIQAYVDLAGLGEGEHRLQVRVAPVQGALFTSVQPNEVTVTLIGVEEKQMRISREVSGSLANGAELSEVTLSSEQCILRGDSAALAKVAAVVAPIMVEGISGILDQVVTLQVRDAEGNAISGLTLLPEQVQVMAVAERRLQSREVDVELVTTGAPADGYEVANISLERQQVTVIGYEDVLKPMTSVPTLPLSLSGQQRSFVALLDLNLPEGASASPTRLRAEVTIVAAVSRPASTTPQPGENTPLHDPEGNHSDTADDPGTGES